MGGGFTVVVSALGPWTDVFLVLLTGASNGSAMVRVLSVNTAERTLLKGFTGGVADLAFAHLNSNQLACLDEAGNFFVWCMAMENGKIQYLLSPIKL